MPYAGVYSTVEIMTLVFAEPIRYGVNVSDTTQLQDSIKKAIGKALSDPTVLTDNGRISFQNLFLFMTDALSQGDSQQKFIAKVLRDDATLQDSMVKTVQRNFQDNAALNDSLTRFAVKGQTESDVTALTDFVKLIFARKMADNTILAEALTRSITFTGIIMSNEPNVNFPDTNDLSVDLEMTMV